MALRESFNALIKLKIIYTIYKYNIQNNKLNIPAIFINGELSREVSQVEFDFDIINTYFFSKLQ